MDVTFCIIFPDNENVILGDCMNSLPKGCEVIVMKTIPSSEESEPIFITDENGYKEYTWNYKQGDFKFNVARNTISKLATKNWIFHIDTDERFCSHQSLELEVLTKTAPDSLGGFIVATFHYYPSLMTPTPPLVQKGIANMIKLHRNKNFEWYNEIHEDIYESIISNGYEVCDSGLLLNHYGYRLTIDKLFLKSIRNKEAFEKYPYLLEKPHFKIQYENTLQQIDVFETILGLKNE